MRTIVTLFVGKKYRKVHTWIFRCFVIGTWVLGFLWYFTGIDLPVKIMCIAFVVYEIPNLLCHVANFLFTKKCDL